MSIIIAEFACGVAKMPIITVEDREDVAATCVRLHDSNGHHDYSLLMSINDAVELSGMLDLAIVRARQHEHDLMRRLSWNPEAQ